VNRLEKDIYDTLDATLGGKQLGEMLSGDEISRIEQAVDRDLDELASRELDEGMAYIPTRKYYPRAAMTSKVSKEFFVTVVGTTPTVYSRRQGPLTWYLIRLLSEFAGHSFMYKKGRLRSVSFENGRVSAEVERMRSPHRCDAVVARLGPDYDSGLARTLSRADSAVSRYAVAGNPIPGDDYAVTEVGSLLFPHEQLAETGYLAFVRDYFRTELWRRVIKQGVPLQGNSDEDDRRALWLHWRGSPAERVKAERSFRAVKSAGSYDAKRRARESLQLLEGQVSGRRNVESTAQYARELLASNIRGAATTDDPTK